MSLPSGEPPITELFSEASKLVKLESRLDNRQLRRDSKDSQINHIDFANDLDLLSPLLMDVKTPQLKLTQSIKELKKLVTECHNCKTHTTPLWRKDPQGNTLCNACGLFLKLHGTTRPLLLKTDVIKKRSSRRLQLSAPKAAAQPTAVPSLFNPRKQPQPLTPQPLAVLAPTLSSLPSLSRYKNILILPKPKGSSTTLAQQAAIPIPLQQSSPSYQPFKRKKLEVSIVLSFNQGLLYKQRNHLPTRQLLTNLARKNLGITFGLAHTTPSLSLTSNNISILNSQKLFFDSQPQRPTPMDMLEVGTPGSVTLALLFGRQPSFTTIPTDVNRPSPRYDGLTPNTPLNDISSSLKRPGPQDNYPAQNLAFMRGIDDEVLMDSGEFFPQFVGTDFMDSFGMLSPLPLEPIGDDPEIQRGFGMPAMLEPAKDLDWLRFEL